MECRDAEACWSLAVSINYVSRQRTSTRSSHTWKSWEKCISGARNRYPAHTYWILPCGSTAHPDATCPFALKLQLAGCRLTFLPRQATSRRSCHSRSPKERLSFEGPILHPICSVRRSQSGRSQSGRSVTSIVCCGEVQPHEGQAKHYSGCHLSEVTGSSHSTCIIVSISAKCQRLPTEHCFGGTTKWGAHAITL